MDASFEESYIPQPYGWWVLSLALFMLPVVVGFSFMIDFPMPVTVLCAAVPFVLAIAFSVSLIRSHGCQRWKFSGDVVTYDSPSDLLGQSFQIPFPDVERVHWDHDGGFASLFTIDGREHRFHVGHISGVRFYEFLRERLASTKTVEPTG